MIIKKNIFGVILSKNEASDVLKRIKTCNISTKVNLNDEIEDIAEYPDEGKGNSLGKDNVILGYEYQDYEDEKSYYHDDDYREMRLLAPYDIPDEIRETLCKVFKEINKSLETQYDPDVHVVGLWDWFY